MRFGEVVADNLTPYVYREAMLVGTFYSSGWTIMSHKWEFQFCTVLFCHLSRYGLPAYLHCLLSYVLMTLLRSRDYVHACAHLLYFNYHWLKKRSESDPFEGLHDISASELIFGMRCCVMNFQGPVQALRVPGV